jgi:hypothetical protein
VQHVHTAQLTWQVRSTRLVNALLFNICDWQVKFINRPDMEVVCTSETSAHLNVTTPHYIPEDSKLHTYHSENLKSHLFMIISLVSSVMVSFTSWFTCPSYKLLMNLTVNLAWQQFYGHASHSRQTKPWCKNCAFLL